MTLKEIQSAREQRYGIKATRIAEVYVETHPDGEQYVVLAWNPDDPGQLLTPIGNRGLAAAMGAKIVELARDLRAEDEP